MWKFHAAEALFSNRETTLRSIEENFIPQALGFPWIFDNAGYRLELHRADADTLKSEFSVVKVKFQVGSGNCFYPRIKVSSDYQSMANAIANNDPTNGVKYKLPTCYKSFLYDNNADLKFYRHVQDTDPGDTLSGGTELGLAKDELCNINRKGSGHSTDDKRRNLKT